MEHVLNVLCPRNVFRKTKLTTVTHLSTEETTSSMQRGGFQNYYICFAVVFVVVVFVFLVCVFRGIFFCVFLVFFIVHSEATACFCIRTVSATGK